MKFISKKDLEAIEIFLKKSKIKFSSPSLNFLEEVILSLKVMPYENISKILEANEKIPEKKLRTPYYVVRDFFENRTGGTCFSLVYFTKSMLDFLGFDAGFFLADRTYGENTHCGIIVNLNGRIYLIDIGYLVYKPIEIKEKSGFFKNRAYNFFMEDRGKCIDVYTITKNGNLKFRYRIKKGKVSEEEFIEAWEKSFEFEMMNHLVLTKEISDGIIYLRDRHYHKISDGKTLYRELKDEELESVIKEIGIEKSVFLKVKSLLGF